MQETRNHSPLIYKFPVIATCHGPARTLATARGHVLPIDEPKERHGDDTAMTPLETLLSAFAGCTNVILNKIAAEKKVSMNLREITVLGHLDRAGIYRNIDVPVVFPIVELTAIGTTDAAPELIDTMLAELRYRCPVSHLMRAAGTKIVETWTWEPGPNG